MQFLTTMSSTELGFFKAKRVISLSNMRLVCGNEHSNILSDFIKEKLGYSGYVLGVRGVLTQTTYDFFKKLDVQLCSGSVLLEIHVDESNMLMFDFAEFIKVIRALEYGEDRDSIIKKMEYALAMGESDKSLLKLVSVPYVCFDDAKAVTSPTFEVECEHIVFIKLNDDIPNKGE